MYDVIIGINPNHSNYCVHSRVKAYRYITTTTLILHVITVVSQQSDTKVADRHLKLILFSTFRIIL